VVESAEELKVLRWRLEQFRQLGFSLSSAVLLASESVDLALARRLIRSGCPLRTAREILL
jgi:hypothetical protein